MAVVMIALGVVLAIFLIPALIWFIIWNASFVHRALIFKQAGADVSDVIMVEDKFKVVERDGFYLIILKRHYSKTPAFPGRFWFKWLKNKTIKFTNEEWLNKNMRKDIARGLMLYQTTEGELRPVGFEKDDDQVVKLKVLAQDNRAWVVHASKKVNELTLSSRKQLISILAVIGAILILGVCFVLFIVYVSEAGADICGNVGTTFIDTAGKVVGG